MLDTRTLHSSPLPGLALVAAGAAVALVAGTAIGVLSPLVAAVLVGAVVSNAGLVPGTAAPGVRVSARQLLRLGIVALGFRLALGDVIDLGVEGLLIVAVVVGVTFTGTSWLGRRLGVGPRLTVLVATGYSICGASAIAAVDGVVEADEDETAYAVGLVTLFGTLSMFVFPLLAAPLGLSDAAFGAWAGGGIHDVAQVLGTAATHGDASSASAIVVKLTRVALLAPVVAAVALSPLAARAGRERQEQGRPSNRPPVIPLFVVGFLVAVCIRSTGLVPDAGLGAIRHVEQGLLAMALVALGIGVRIDGLRRLGGRPLVLGTAAWLLVAAASYAGVRLVGG